jgi:hypothetical protein
MPQGKGLPGIDLVIAWNAKPVGGVGIRQIIAIGRVVIQVQIDKEEGEPALQSAPGGFCERICGLYGKIDGLMILIFIKDNRDFRQPGNPFFDHPLKRMGQFHRYGIRSDVVKEVSYAVCKLQAVMDYRNGINGAKGLQGFSSHEKVFETRGAVYSLTARLSFLCDIE